MFFFGISKGIMECQHASGYFFLKDFSGEGAESFVLRYYTSGQPSHKKPDNQCERQKKSDNDRRTGSAKRRFHRFLSKERFLLSYWKKRDCMLNLVSGVKKARLI